MVDDDYRTIGPYAKDFARRNKLNAIAPLHDRTESYTTVAYEQHEQMPDCEYFAQTIASGMGPIGFLRGQENLVKLGMRRKSQIPRIICVQAEQSNSIYRAFISGKTTITAKDLTEPSKPMYEPTLNSTNPVANYPELYKCLTVSNGLITDASPHDVEREGMALMNSLERRKIWLRFDLEKSLLIGFAGLVRLAVEGKIQAAERVLLLATGRAERQSTCPIPPDLVIRPSVDDPEDVLLRLNHIAESRK